jgi:hypothetical protein
MGPSLYKVDISYSMTEKIGHSPDNEDISYFLTEKIAPSPDSEDRNCLLTTRAGPFPWQERQDLFPDNYRDRTFSLTIERVEPHKPMQR